MTEQSAFSKKNIQATTVESRGVLEELNLPPQLISFIRRNSRKLIFAVSALAVVFVAWTVYDHYADLQRDQAVALLSVAMQEKEDDKRLLLLAEVQEQYSRTSAATWSLIEIAHIDYRNGKFDEAAKKYEKVLAGLAPDSFLLPLLVYRIAQTYEQQGNNENAIKSYQTLLDIPGFSGEAFLAMGRIHESSGEPAKAREVYEKHLAALAEGAFENRPSGDLAAMIKNKLARLKSVKSGGEELGTVAGPQ